MREDIAAEKIDKGEENFGTPDLRLKQACVRVAAGSGQADGGGPA